MEVEFKDNDANLLQFFMINSKNKSILKVINPTESLQFESDKYDIFFQNNDIKVRKIYEGKITYDTEELKLINAFSGVRSFHSISDQKISRISTIKQSEILRFIYHKNFNVSEAFSAASNSCNFFNEIFPLTITEIHKNIFANKLIYTFGRDKRFRPNIILNFHKIINDKVHINDIRIALLFLIEFIRLNMFIPGKIENFNLIIDLKEDLHNNNRRKNEENLFNFIFDTINNNYPLRINALFINDFAEFAFSNSKLKNFNGMYIISHETMKLKIHPEQLEEKFKGKAPNRDNDLDFIGVKVSEVFYTPLKQNMRSGSVTKNLVDIALNDIDDMKPLKLNIDSGNKVYNNTSLNHSRESEHYFEINKQVKDFNNKIAEAENSRDEKSVYEMANSFSVDFTNEQSSVYEECKEGFDFESAKSFDKSFKSMKKSINKSIKNHPRKMSLKISNKLSELGDDNNNSLKIPYENDLPDKSQNMNDPTQTQCVSVLPSECNEKEITKFEVENNGVLDDSKRNIEFFNNSVSTKMNNIFDTDNIKNSSNKVFSSREYLNVVKDADEDEDEKPQNTKNLVFIDSQENTSQKENNTQSILSNHSTILEGPSVNKEPGCVICIKSKCNIL